MTAITLLVASTGKNMELAQRADTAFQAAGATTTLVDLAGLDLPLYTPERDANGTPEQISKLSDTLRSSDGLMVIAPEYNGGLPPVLTNCIAWVSRSGDDWRDAFNGKPVVIGTHSGSGGINALAAMRIQLAYLGCNVLGRQIHTHYQKELNEDSLNSVVAQLLKIA